MSWTFVPICPHLSRPLIGVPCCTWVDGATLMVCGENTLVRTSSLGMHVKTKWNRPLGAWKGEYTQALTYNVLSHQENFYIIWVLLVWRINRPMPKVSKQNSVQIQPDQTDVLQPWEQVLKREVKRRIAEPMKGVSCSHRSEWREELRADTMELLWVPTRGWFLRTFLFSVYGWAQKTKDRTEGG